LMHTGDVDLELVRNVRRQVNPRALEHPK
jgi:hypothetical protein